MAIAGLSLYQDARDPNSRWVQVQANMGGGSTPIHSFRLNPEQAAQFEGAGLKYEKVFNMAPFAGYGGQVQDYNDGAFKSLMSEGSGYANSPLYKDFFSKISTPAQGFAGSDLANNQAEQQRLVAGAWGGADNPFSSGKLALPGTTPTAEQAANLAKTTGTPPNYTQTTGASRDPKTANSDDLLNIARFVWDNSGSGASQQKMYGTADLDAFGGNRASMMKLAQDYIDAVQSGTDPVSWLVAKQGIHQGDQIAREAAYANYNRMLPALKAAYDAHFGGQTAAIPQNAAGYQQATGAQQTMAGFTGAPATYQAATQQQPAGAPTPTTPGATPQGYVLKNPGIATANPEVAANKSYINALYKEAYGRDATQKELDTFVGRKVKDAANLILGQSRSPFAAPAQPSPTPGGTGTQQPTTEKPRTITVGGVNYDVAPDGTVTASGSAVQDAGAGTFSVNDLRAGSSASAGAKQIADMIAANQTKRNEQEQKLLATMTKDEEELGIETQLADVRKKAKDMELANESAILGIEDQPIAMGFITGQSREQNERLQLNLKTLAAQEANLMTRLGLKQDARKMAQDRLEKGIEFTQDDIDNYIKMQTAIRAQEDAVTARADKLTDNARQSLATILTQLKGVDPDNLDAADLSAISKNAQQAGIPLSLVLDGMKATYNQDVFDNNLKTIKEINDQKPTSYKEWEAYVAEQKRTGQKALSYNDYQTMDANRKRSISNSTTTVLNYDQTLQTLNNAKGQDGFVNTDTYKRERNKAKDKSSFDDNYSYMLNPKDATAQAFIPKQKQGNAASSLVDKYLTK